MHEIKADWQTEPGYRAVVLYVNDSHHCGYVNIPADHPLYGLDYDSKLPNYTVDPNTTIGKKSPMTVLAAACDPDYANSDLIPPRLDVIIDVHGGLTFAGNDGDYPVESDGWWFGFDCAHLGDKTKYLDGYSLTFDTESTFKDVPYVVEECERLALQLKTLETELKGTPNE